MDPEWRSHAALASPASQPHVVGKDDCDEPSGSLSRNSQSFRRPKAWYTTCAPCTGGRTMGIKYDRKRYAEEARERHTALARQPGQVRLSPRNRLVVIYGGIGAFMLLLLALGSARESVFAAGTRDGIGTITAKSMDHLLRADTLYVVEVETKEGRRERKRVVVER